MFTEHGKSIIIPQNHFHFYEKTALDKHIPLVTVRIDETLVPRVVSIG